MTSWDRARIFWGIHNPDNTRFQEQFRRGLDLTIANLPWTERLSKCGEPLHIAPTLDELLNEAWRSQCEYAVIQTAGHVLDNRFCRRLSIFVESASPLIIGHILDHFDETYSLHDQCLFLNLSALRKRGEPKWVSDRETIPAFLRDKDNIHDDYTPLKIEALSESRINKRRGGSGLLALLRPGEIVHNFGLQIREVKLHLYPDKESFPEKLKILAEREEQTKNNVFIWNSETLSEPLWPYGKIENLIAVASGFKPFKILHDNGFTSRTKIVFIDNNPNQLMFMKHLLKNWDGIGYGSFIETFHKNHPNLRISPSSFFKEGRYRNADEELHRHFGGKGAWLDLWSQVRRLDITFHQEDFVRNPYCVKDQIEKAKSPTYIWFSGAFWYNSTCSVPFSRKFESFRSFYGLCSRAPQKVWLSGDDVFGVRRNETPEEHLHFDGRSAKCALRVMEPSIKSLSFITFIRQKLQRPRKTKPWRELNLDFPHQEMLLEAKELFERGYFVAHRSLFENNVGWFSTCLHGLDWRFTNTVDKYRKRKVFGYGLPDKMDWTEIAKLAPVTTEFIKSLSALRNYGRIRIMALLPGGFIAPHRDQVKSGFSVVNFALNNPEGCEFYFRDYGVAPFKPGKALALDLSVEHWVINRSNEVRFHLIPHGEWDKTFLENA